MNIYNINFLHVPLFSLFTLLSSYSFAECPIDTPCQLVYSFDLGRDKDFRLDNHESECGSPDKESYLSSSYLNDSTNNLNYDETNKSIELIVNYVGETHQYCHGSLRRFKTARLISKHDINSYYSKKGLSTYSGFIEFEAKMPACKFTEGIDSHSGLSACVGMWPGLWLFNFSDWRVEYDILEMNYRYNKNTSGNEDPSLGIDYYSMQFYTGTVGYYIYNREPLQTQRKFGVLTYNNLSAEFHKYGMRWDCDETSHQCVIKFTFDQRLQATATFFVARDCNPDNTSFYMAPTEKTFCTTELGIFNSFGASSTDNLLHVILSLHVSNLGVPTKTYYPFKEEDKGRELGRMIVKSITLYQ